MKLIAILALVLSIASASITKECMLTTDEFGDLTPNDDFEFVSNMEDILSLGDRLMFMRPVNIYVCSRA